MIILKDDSKSRPNWSGYTVLLPSISVGNVAQLACDLLIATLKLQRIGNVIHPALIPIFGPSAFAHDINKVAACEIYEDRENKLIVVQIRSPLIPKYINSFNTELGQIFGECSRIIIMGSSHKFEKHEVESPQFEYIATDAFKTKHKQIMSTLSWQEFKGSIIHGGGNALKLYQTFSTEKKQVLLLFNYVVEGDNSPDAFAIVRELSTMCEEYHLRENNALKLTVPASWKLLFGNDAPSLIF